MYTTIKQNSHKYKANNAAFLYAVAYLMLAVIFVIPPSTAYASIDIQEVKAKRGKIWVNEDRSTPVIAMEIIFKHQGYAYDPKNKQGLNSLALSLLNNAKNLNAKEFYDETESRGIQIEFNANKDHVFMSVKTITENLEHTVYWVQKLLHSYVVGNEGLSEAKKRNQTILMLHNDRPSHVLSKNTTNIMFGAHPYSNEPYGTIESLNAITLPDVKKYLAQLFVSGEVMVSISGDITANKARKVINDMLPEADYTTEKQDDIPYKEITKSDSDIYRIPYDTPQAQMAFFQSGIPIEHPSYYPMLILIDALGGNTLNSRLGLKLRKESGLTYGISMGMQNNEKSNAIIGTTATINAEKAIAIIRDVIQHTKAHGITKQEFKKAQSACLNAFDSQLTTNGQVARYMSTMQRLNLPRDYITLYKKKIQHVNLDAVNKAAKSLLTPDEMTFVVVEKKK